VGSAPIELRRVLDTASSSQNYERSGLNHPLGIKFSVSRRKAKVVPRVTVK